MTQIILTVVDPESGSCGIIFNRLLRSSSGLGHRPLTAKIAGSNPVRSTKKESPPLVGSLFCYLDRVRIRARGDTKWSPAVG